MKTVVLAAACAAASLVASAAPAQQHRAVAVADLDLTHRDGIAALDRRIAVAARAVCSAPGAAAYGSYAAARHCREETRRAAAVPRAAAIEAARGVALAGR